MSELKTEPAHSTSILGFSTVRKLTRFKSRRPQNSTWSKKKHRLGFIHKTRDRSKAACAFGEVSCSTSWRSARQTSETHSLRSLLLRFATLKLYARFARSLRSKLCEANYFASQSLLRRLCERSEHTISLVYKRSEAEQRRAKRVHSTSLPRRAPRC